MPNLNLNLNVSQGRAGAGVSGIQSQTVNINFGNTTGTYISSGNWNHAFQNFVSGAIPITGDNSGQSLASLRNTGGTLTGWTISTPGANFAGDTVGQNTAGLYPQSATREDWSNPSGARAFSINGLTVGRTYRFKILLSVDTVTEATSLADITVAGSSGGITTTGFNERGNTSNLIGGANGFTVVPTAGGVVTITLTLNTGHCAISVMTITD